jgi:hypothetical protein
MRRFFTIRYLLIVSACFAVAFSWMGPVRGSRVKVSDRSMDITIDGPGYFRVVDDETCETRYTRSGRLVWNDDRQLCIESKGRKWPIDPPMYIPEDCTETTINKDGHVIALRKDYWHVIGAFQISTFDIPPRFDDPWNVGLPTTPFAIEKPHEPSNGSGSLVQGRIESGPPSKTQIVIPVLCAIFASCLLNNFPNFLRFLRTTSSGETVLPECETTH